MESDLTEGPVCLFDSGIGGLNLLAECVKRLPHRDFVYYADNDHVPYGNLSEREIQELADAAFAQIARLNPCAAVIACNTVTALCAERLRASHPFPILGIQPAVKPAVKAGGSCLILATEATVKSDSFRRLVATYGNGDTVAYPCKRLAEYIEENIFSLPDRLPEGLLPDFSPSAVVLGCTHYTFVKKAIENQYVCPIFDGMVGTADHLVEILGKFDPEPNRSPKITFIHGDFNKNRAIFESLN